ncbi:hypothetical protein V5799_019432 [Amblyomma americanum]|uniref:Uncharacterized protein n=1 Tax=Amblyomma americanum TaxID=6943 RepID=A0AAQ4EWY7_AMBAM
MLFLSASASERRRRPVDSNCERGHAIDVRRFGQRSKCMYVCRGSPRRTGFEPDGTPCDRRGKQRLPGVCVRGRCVRPERTRASFVHRTSGTERPTQPGTGQDV